MRHLTEQPNDMSFTDEGFYQCHSCGNDGNRIEDVRAITSKRGPEVELTLSCDRCATLSVFQILNSSGRVLMGVVAHTMNNLDNDRRDQKAEEMRHWP